MIIHYSVEVEQSDVSSCGIRAEFTFFIPYILIRLHNYQYCYACFLKAYNFVVLEISSSFGIYL